MDVYRLTEMTWQEVESALWDVELAIIPFGAQEQHGPHMSESCDSVLAESISNKLAERLFPRAIVTPTINMGISFHHINFPGTISLQSSTVLSVLEDIITSLLHHNVQKFLIMNAHGGNQSTLDIASTQFSRKYNCKVFYAKTTDSAKSSIEMHIHSNLYGHSCEREVSEALYLAPYLVRSQEIEKGDIQEGVWNDLRPNSPIRGPYQYEDMTKNGAIGNAHQASREIGQQIVEEALDNLEESIRKVVLKGETKVSP